MEIKTVLLLNFSEYFVLCDVRFECTLMQPQAV